MKLCDHLGGEFTVLARGDATPDQVRHALKAMEAVPIFSDLFLGLDGPDGSMRDALLDMAGSARFDLFWQRSLGELKEFVASQLAEDGPLVMIRETSREKAPRALFRPRYADEIFGTSR